MESMSQKLKEAKNNRPDVFSIIGVISCVSEKRIREITKGSEMLAIERVVLDFWLPIVSHN